MSENEKNLLLRDFHPECLLKKEEHVPEKAAVPAIDGHNHLFGDVPADQLLATMDACGVETFVNVTGNVSMPYDDKGYTIKRREIDEFIDGYVIKFPGRFACLTMADFAQWGDFTLLKDDGFADRCVETLEKDIAKGALGLKVTKELGLAYTDWNGEMIPVDDERLFPIWAKAGELGVPVLIHTSDPVGFFLPIDRHNEHYLPLQEYPRWSFHGSHFSKNELLAQRNRMIKAHPKTTFICPHVANHVEDLRSVAAFLDDNPNVHIDFSARIDELGRQPYSARECLIKYKDRIIFGVDMPVTPDVYRCHFRFLETQDECFEYPDYMGRWGYSRWRIHGLGLPAETLEKIYRTNVRRLLALPD